MKAACILTTYVGENEAAACQQSRNKFVVVYVGTILAESVADCHVSIVLPSWRCVMLSAFVFCTFDTFSASFPAIEYKPCAIEYKFKLFCTLYCMCQIYDNNYGGTE